jgi:hypothetical protein
VAGSLPRQGMSNFMQEHLVNKVHIPSSNQVLGKGYPAVFVITKSGSANRSVEAERVVSDSVTLE